MEDLYESGWISYEDLDHKFGEGMFPGSSFMYTEDENKFRNDLRKFLASEIVPLVPQIENEEKWEAMLEAYRKLGKAGFIKFSFPESIGGGGKGHVYRAILGEEIAAVNSAIAVTYGTSANLFTGPILYYGTEEQKSKFLPKIMSGELIGAIAITEPTAGSDAIVERQVAK